MFVSRVHVTWKFVTVDRSSPSFLEDAVGSSLERQAENQADFEACIVDQTDQMDISPFQKRDILVVGPC